MSEAWTPEDSFTAGDVYFVDPATVVITCPSCGHFSPYHIELPEQTCSECGRRLPVDARQAGKRPYVVMGSQPVLEWDNTVVAVPLTTQEAAITRPYAVQIDPSAENGLSRVSWALPSKVRTINKTSFSREGRTGRLSNADLIRLQRALVAALFDEPPGAP